MHLKKYPLASLFLGITFSVFLVALSFTSIRTSAQPLVSQAEQPRFFNLDGTLTPGSSINPQYPIFGGDRPFNFSLEVTGGGTASLSITTESGTEVWAGDVKGGETLWGNGTLTAGNNTIAIANDSGDSLDFHIQMYDLPSTPYNWLGQADPTGLNSHARVIFPTSGLYQFDFGVNDGGRYEFRVDTDYIQKNSTREYICYLLHRSRHS